MNIMQSPSKIKFVTDTASDIPDDLLLEYDIDMLSVPIAIDGIEYLERRSFTIFEFYKMLARSKEIPKTSRVPQDEYIKCYKRAYSEGYTDIINVTINGKGSSTIESARLAAKTFFADNPGADGKFKIHTVDSRIYSIAYGHPIVEGAKMAREGKTADEILTYLYDFFESVEVYLACFTLDYAKKSGRITATAAFVGDVLGVRPIVSFIDGVTKIVTKVRGEKQLLQQLIKCYEDNRESPDSFVAVIGGEIPEYGLSVQQALQTRLKRDVPLYYAGASIVINTGPKLAAIACRSKRKH